MPEYSETDIRKRIGNGSILGISVDTAVFHRYGCHLDHPVLAKLNQVFLSAIALAETAMF
jgi:hypothetical protein